jgi:hypothetical protein
VDPYLDIFLKQNEAKKKTQVSLLFLSRKKNCWMGFPGKLTNWLRKFPHSHITVIALRGIATKTEVRRLPSAGY